MKSSSRPNSGVRQADRWTERPPEDAFKRSTFKTRSSAPRKKSNIRSYPTRSQIFTELKKNKLLLREEERYSNNETDNEVPIIKKKISFSDSQSRNLVHLISSKWAAKGQAHKCIENVKPRSIQYNESRSTTSDSLSNAIRKWCNSVKNVTNTKSLQRTRRPVSSKMVPSRRATIGTSGSLSRAVREWCNTAQQVPSSKSFYRSCERLEQTVPFRQGQNTSQHVRQDAAVDHFEDTPERDHVMSNVVVFEAVGGARDNPESRRNEKKRPHFSTNTSNRKSKYRMLPGFKEAVYKNENNVHGLFIQSGDTYKSQQTREVPTQTNSRTYEKKNIRRERQTWPTNSINFRNRGRNGNGVLDGSKDSPQMLHKKPAPPSQAEKKWPIARRDQNATSTNNHEIRIIGPNGSPSQLYNGMGFPLTDLDGYILKDSRGNFLVTLDEFGTPACCNDGKEIFVDIDGTKAWLVEKDLYEVVHHSHKRKIQEMSRLISERSRPKTEEKPLSSKRSLSEYLPILDELKKMDISEIEKLRQIVSSKTPVEPEKIAEPSRQGSVSSTPEWEFVQNPWLNRTIPGAPTNNFSLLPNFTENQRRLFWRWRVRNNIFNNGPFRPPQPRHLSLNWYSIPLDPNVSSYKPPPNNFYVSKTRGFQ